MRTGRPKKPLNLTEEERTRLESLAHRARRQALLARRARVVLACAEGLENKVVAKRLRCSLGMVGKWRSRFLATRLEGLSKYADHLPLYRQAEIYQREGVDLDRSTLADWVGGASRTLRPLVEALKKYVLGAEKLHGDDVPVPVLEPGRGKTKTGRLWTYVRDDRPAGS